MLVLAKLILKALKKMRKVHLSTTWSGCLFFASHGGLVDIGRLYSDYGSVKSSRHFLHSGLLDNPNARDRLGLTECIQDTKAIRKAKNEASDINHQHTCAIDVAETKKKH